MKKTIFFMLSAIWLAVPAFAGIPAKVADAFRTRFASATGVEWKRTITGDYKADFNMGGDRMLAKFDEDGQWLESEKMLKTNEVPNVVRKGLDKTRYSTWEIKSCYEELLPNEKPGYHVTLEKGEFKRKKLLMDQEGQLIPTTAAGDDSLGWYGVNYSNARDVQITG